MPIICSSPRHLAMYKNLYFGIRFIYKIFLQMANGSDDEEDVEDEKSLYSKLCLFVESLYAAVEIGIAL